MQPIIGIHSVPRSGSTWLGTIFDSSPVTKYCYQPFFCYEFRDRIHARSTEGEVIEYFNELLQSNNSFLNQWEAKKLGLVPTFGKISNNFLVYKSVRFHTLIDLFLNNINNYKVIILVRDPRGTIASWKSAPREFRKDLNWNFKEEWYAAPKKNLGLVSEYFGMTKWIQFTKMAENWEKLYPKKVKIVCYSDLIVSPIKVSSELFSFSGIDINQQTFEYLDSNKGSEQSDGTYSVFKKIERDTKWRNVLSTEISTEIRRLTIENQLEKYLDPEMD